MASNQRQAANQRFTEFLKGFKALRLKNPENPLFFNAIGLLGVGNRRALVGNRRKMVCNGRNVVGNRRVIHSPNPNPVAS